jgi:hypothetical protein
VCLERRHERKDPEYGWLMRTAKCDIVKVGRRLDCLYFSTDVKIVYSITKIGDGGMSRIICSKDLYSFLDSVWSVDVLDYQFVISEQSVIRSEDCCLRTSYDSQRLIITRIPEGDASAWGNRQTSNGLVSYIERNGYRKKCPISQAKTFNDAMI